MRGTEIIFRNGAAEVVEYDVPKPGRGEILVKTRLTHVSAGSEVNGLKRSGPEPMRVGYTTVGTIVEVGPGVTGYQVGERVLTMQKHTSHTISEPLEPIPHGANEGRHYVQKLDPNVPDGRAS